MVSCKERGDGKVRLILWEFRCLRDKERGYIEKYGYTEPCNPYAPCMKHLPTFTINLN